MPADMKLLSTSLSNTSTEIPPKASSPSSAQDIEQALPCNTHTGTQSKQTPQPLALQTHSIPALPLETATKIAQPCPAPGWRLCLSQQKLQSPGSPGQRCLLQYPGTYCIAFQRSCSSRAHMARSAPAQGSLLSTIQLQSLCMCGESPALGAGGFWLQWLLTLSIASGVC